MPSRSKPIKSKSQSKSKPKPSSKPTPSKPKVSKPSARTMEILGKIKQSAPCFDKLNAKEQNVYLVWSLDTVHAFKTSDMARFARLATTEKPRAVVDKAKCRT